MGYFLNFCYCKILWMSLYCNTFLLLGHIVVSNILGLFIICLPKMTCMGPLKAVWEIGDKQTYACVKMGISGFTRSSVEQWHEHWSGNSTDMDSSNHSTA